MQTSVPIDEKCRRHAHYFEVADNFVVERRAYRIANAEFEQKLLALFPRSEKLLRANVNSDDADFVASILVDSLEFR